MARIVYINGQFLNEDSATLSIFDRGFLFADSVYEVAAVLNGQLIENDAHLLRLQRSLNELRIELPIDIAEIRAAQLQIVRRNQLQEGMLYLQITRGEADRDFAFPVNAKPNIVMFTQQKNLLSDPIAKQGIAVISVPDLRWKRRDIKTVGLLPAVMAKQAALDAGAKDAWFVEDGFVTEGSSNNAFIVNARGDIVTRQLSNDILHGITRAAVLRLAKEHAIRIIEEPFTITQAQQASEAFVTSASTFVYPVISVDGTTLGNGAPGPLAKRLRELYIQMALDSVR